MTTQTEISQSNFNTYDDAEDTIDLLELFFVLLHKWWILVIGFVVGALVCGIGTKLLVTPQYKATSMIYVFSKTTSITSLADLQVGDSLAVDFQIVGTTREVIEKVAQKLELNMSYEELLSTVSITNPSKSHILQIVVTNPDPVLAANISNALAQELRQRIADVMNTDAPSVVDKAVVPKRPASPSVKKNAALGGIAVSVLLAGFFVVVFLLDDTIKNEDDVRRYLNANILAEVAAENPKKKKSI